MTKSVIIIGAGLGGLAAAIKLRSQGLNVTVFEKLPQVGGRCNRLNIDGFNFDTGPTMLMMTEEIENLFSSTGRSIQNYLDLRLLDPHSRFQFHDGSQMLLTSNLEALEKEFNRIEPGSGENLKRWLETNQKLFKVGMADFIDRNSPKLISATKPENISFFLNGQVTSPIYQSLSKYFQDERLKDAIAFAALYLGMNPFEAPSIYSLLPYAELSSGLYYPLGGMHKIPQALERLALELGINIKCNTEVVGTEKDGNVIETVVLKDGTKHRADVIVFNVDLPRAYKDLIELEHPQQRRFNYTCGAYLVFLGLRSIPSDFQHHQCFIPDNFKKSMDELFKEDKIPTEPVFYTCCPTVTDSSLAPKGMHCLTILAPVPSNSSEIDWQRDSNILRNKLIGMLAKYGLNESEIVLEKVFTPAEMGNKFNLENNAAFGLCHRLSQMGPLRPRNKDHRFKNLYFVGASTHPGNGIPMVLKSGKLTAERILNESREWVRQS